MFHLLLSLTGAFAGDLADFEGNWAMDLARSDEAGQRLMQMGRTDEQNTTTTAGSRFSPDGGETNSEEQVSKGWSNLQYLVMATSEIRFRAEGDDLAVRLPGDDEAVVDLGGGWTKVKGDHNYRVRASLYDGHLLVQRKGNGNLVSETWLPAKADNERAVVVEVKSSLLGMDVEFRRIYQRLQGPKAPDSASSETTGSEATKP